MLELILGCMFASKTVHGIAIGNRYKAIQKKVIYINHSSDIRYGTLDVCSHDGQRSACISVQNLYDVRSLEEYIAADVVIVEEAQFFDDLLQFVSRETDAYLEKHFVIIGLSADSNRKPIGNVLSLIPYSEKVTVLHGFCVICKDGTTGHFTKRKTTSSDIQQQQKQKQHQQHIGGSNEYECLCRKCYLLPSSSS